MNRVVVLELNELCPPLIERLVAAGDLPNFERLRDTSTTWITDAGVPDGELLNPWVQWVTVHTGLEPARHGALRLGEPVEVDVPTVAEAVGAAGGSAWLCGPMNHPRPHGELRGALLPDPWCDWLDPVPGELATFHRFIAAQVQEHTNDDARLDAAGAARFVAFVARRGLRPSTVASLVGQLVGERTGRRGRWERAMVLDRLQWDLFRWYRRRTGAAYATFFSNSTAHAQHLYWQDMEPERFPDHTADPQLADAVPASYRAIDRLVGDAMALCGDDTTLVFCTALSQQANLSGAMLDRACFHRPKDFRALCDRLGVDGVSDVAPVMAEEFHLRFASSAAAGTGADRLRGVTVAGAPAFAVRQVDDDLFVGCTQFQPLPADVELELPGGGRVPFHEVLYRADAPRSGTHHGDGMLWIHRPGQHHHVDGGRVDLESVAPTLLSLVGVEAPAHMEPALAGPPGR